MNRWLAAVLCAVALLFGSALGEQEEYPDGVYRGFYYEDGIEQVAVQFELKDGCFKSVVLRGLRNTDGDYMLESASEQQKEALRWYRQLAEYLVGRGVGAIDALYAPESILEIAQPEGGASSSPLISALWDGLNRRPYKHVDTSKLPEAQPYADGHYVGIYDEGGGEEVVLEFTVKDHCIASIDYQVLQYKGEDYLDEEASDAVRLIRIQFQQLIDYLVGKPISAVNDLYLPGNIVPDTDVSSGATIRAPKVISAIWDGLNKNTYRVD